MAGPACGGPVRVDSPCPDEPVAVKVDLYSAGFAELLGSVTSDAQGRFQFDGLSPGDYILQVDTGENPFPSGPPVNVHVTEGDLVPVTMHLDTGIR